MPSNERVECGLAPGDTGGQRSRSILPAPVRRFIHLVAPLVAMAIPAGAPWAAEPWTCVDRARNEAPVCSSFGPQCKYDLSTRKKFALVIGVQEYDLSSLVLHTPEQDARDLAEVLGKDHGYDVRCILNPTKEQAEAEVAFAAEVANELNTVASGPEDIRFLFYFAGHGFDFAEDKLGHIVFRDASQADRKALGVSAILRDLGAFLASRKVHPFVLIDACRNELFESTRAATPRAFSTAELSLSFPSSPGYFIGFAVAKGNTAPDGRNRFMTYLKPELQERGMSMSGICVAARTEASRGHDLWVDQGPQCVDKYSSVAQNQFFRLPVDERCEDAFSDIWKLIDLRRRNEPRRSFMTHWAVSEDASDCETWNSQLGWGGQQCADLLQKRFRSLFPKCSPKITVATLSETVIGQPQDPSWLRIARARPPQPSDVDRPAVQTKNLRYHYRGAKPPTAVDPSWSDVVVTQKSAGLRYLPQVDEVPHTVVEEGTRLTLDCSDSGGTLRCPPGWLGARYRPRGETQEWRVFVPTADVAPERPLEQVEISFKGEHSPPDEASVQRLTERARAFSGRRDVRIRITSRYAGGTGDVRRDQKSRIGGLLRLSAMDSIVRAAMLPDKTSNWERTRKYELIEALGEKPIPDGMVEFYSR